MLLGFVGVNLNPIALRRKTEELSKVTFLRIGSARYFDSSLRVSKNILGEDFPRYKNLTKAWVKRRTSHVPNLMLMRKFYCPTSLALDSANVKFDV